MTGVGPNFNDKRPYKRRRESQGEEEKAMCRWSRGWSSSPQTKKGLARPKAEAGTDPHPGPSEKRSQA